jgi:hypothetical protein
MASWRLISMFDGAAPEPHQRPGYQKLSLFNGLLIGTALALGSWGQEAARLARVPLQNRYTSLVLSSMALILLCGLAGWFTAWIAGRLERNWLTFLIWLGTAGLCTLIIGYQPYLGRTLAEWVADTQAWGLPIYEAQGITNIAVMLGGLAIIIILSVLALLQSTRLEQAVNELGHAGQMNSKTWFILLWPMIFVALAAALTSSAQINPAAEAAFTVHKAIEVAQTAEGDLHQLGIEAGVNYSALNAVREQLTENYTLRIGEIDPQSTQTFVLAEFDNGAWINCHTISDQLTFCYDASPPYTTGLLSLITGEAPPENCRGCPPRASDVWQTWLQERAPLLGSDPQFERLGQWGGYVLMRVTAADGSYSFECLFDNMSPVQVASCYES